MRLLMIASLVILLAYSCLSPLKEDEGRFLSQNIPGSQPLKYLPELVEEGKIIHKGIFAPDLNEFYFTTSNKDFTEFDIMQIHKIGAEWSAPSEAFCNSEFDDHGMSFSPDGSYLYLSSTRPVMQADIPKTWHIWRSKKTNAGWSSFEFVDIPNMRDKLVSHPSITRDGELFFHASELDYSNMRIYSSKLVNGVFQDAAIILVDTLAQCTPLISPDGKYIVYGEVAAHTITLMISHLEEDNNWGQPEKLIDNPSNSIGQGNPYITPDEKFLFFTSHDTTKDARASSWYINWVSLQTTLP